MAGTSNGTVVRTEGLSKSYKGVDALKGLDLHVSEHSIFGFLGPNGAGKTTTVKLLLGLSRPSAGSAVFGRDVVEDSLEIRMRVGYLAQDPRYYNNMTARQTLRFRAGFYYSGAAGAVMSLTRLPLQFRPIGPCITRANRPDKNAAPFIVFPARSLIARVLLRESPAPRSASSEKANTWGAVGKPAAADRLLTRW